MATCKKSALAFLVFVVMLSLMTIQKTSLFVSVRAVLQNNVSVESGYAIITLLLLPPYLFSLFLSIWNVPFIRRSTSSESPPLTNICLGVFAAIVEAGCVVIFTTRVMALLPVFVAVLALNGTFAITCLLSLIKKGMKASHSDEDIPGLDVKLQSEDEGTLCCNGARIMASALCVLVFPAVSFFLYGMGLATLVTSFSLAVIPILLGLIWTKELQEYIIDPSLVSSLCHKRFTVLYGLVKIGGIICFILLEFYLKCTVHEHKSLLHRYLSGFDTVLKESFACLPLLVHFMTSILGFAFSYVSLTLCLPLFGFVLPSLLSTVASVFVCVILAPDLYGIDETSFFGPFSQHLICATILTWSWAWPYILQASSLVRKPQYLLIPYKWLFLGYEMNSVFTDQKFILNYDTYRSYQVMKHTQKAKNRIYICTTMYREADYEMERLLMSLEEISKDDCLKNVHLESNIFMDNGCSNLSLKDFATQLVGLLLSKFGVELGKTRCWSTPYGMQLFFQLPSGLPMFVHLKDPKKVKSKKRWSQAMYINYVMRFRKAKWRNDNDYFTLKRATNACSALAQENSAFIEDKLHEMDSGFILRAISTIDSPKLAGFKSYRPESDQGFSSIDDSTCPCSESSTQTPVSSKESSDVDSLTEYKGPIGILNKGFESDERKNNITEESPQAKPTSPESIATGQPVELDDQAHVDDDHTYILATDADMDFKAGAVRELLDMCNEDKRIGAACGRTHPIGKKCSAVVWHQVFEYAKDFWMIKNAQNIIGSVSCCPGCFSLYRASAIRDVMSKYSSPTRSPFSVYVKDTGEDRWMATLMMINGWKMRYSPFADNTTYCPDTFQEYYKQRKRWILSDMANAILVMRNLIQLTRNNECFSLVYIIYLVNMTLNNIITPGTAIVMITAGMELVFGIPYIYTTIPLALLVYAYAGLCTWLSVRNQGIMTSALTVVMGCLFASVAIFGSYKITAGMVHQINIGDFHFQQHYVILLLALSLVYAAFMHPLESYQIVYGVAYLFIFPAMHVLLPIYSIANIVDQSWGTRDSNTAKLPRISCMPSLKSFKNRFKKKKKQDEKETPNMELNDVITSLITDMAEGDDEAKEEHTFWDNLVSTSLGVNVNLDLKKEELEDGLRRFRNRSLAGFMLINALWLSFLSYFYMGIDSPLSKLNIYGVFSGALYGFTLFIQILGLTAGRTEQIIRKLARFVYGEDESYWVSERETKHRK